MKSKNVVLTALALIVMLISTLPVVSYATNNENTTGTVINQVDTNPVNNPAVSNSTTKELGIVSKREGGTGYQVNGKNVWKIVEYINNGISYSNTFYCIKGGRGFGGNSHIENIQYDSSFDLKDLMTMSNNTIRTILPSSSEITETIDGDTYTYTDYNAVLWLLDNMYLPQYDNEQKNLRDIFLSNVFGNETILLTDDDIEVVQQCAIWYFTNKNETIVDEATFNNSTELKNQYGNYSNYQSTLELNNAYHMETLPQVLISTTLAPTESFDQDDLDFDMDRQDQAEALYTYLIKTAKKMAEKYGTGANKELAPVSLNVNNNTITTEIVSGKCILGPIKITQNSEEYISLEGILTDQAGTELTYTLLNSNKQPVSEGTTLRDLVNKDFYIQITDKKEITSLTFTIEVSYETREATLWTKGGAELSEQPIVEVKTVIKSAQQNVTVQIDRKEFDLALRKFITSINGVPTTNRVPEVDLSTLETGTTATYEHSKIPLEVESGDIVSYKIRIYNEGEIDGYAEEIADYIPEGLGFIVGYNLNSDNKWIVADNANINSVKLTTIPNATNNLSLSDFTGVTSLGQVEVVVGKVKITTDKLKYDSSDTIESNLIEAFDKELAVLDYKDVEVACVVLGDVDENTNLKNIAEISKCVDREGNQILDVNTAQQSENLMEDRDSLPGNVNINTYPENTNVQDDDDFEKLVVKDNNFDLALRKFITAVGNTKITDRKPIPSVNSTTGAITYIHPKDVVRVKNGDLVEYTIRVYNEGSTAGYAKEVRDTLPEGLEFVADNEINKQYGWKVDVSDNKTLLTNYLSRENNANNLIPAFDKSTMNAPEYKDIKIVCKVNLPNNSSTILINTAEIEDDSNSTGGDVTDEDSTPGNDKTGEDDIDIEKVQIVIFDLALRKFITQVNMDLVTDREPEVIIDEDGAITYEHKKDPVLVKNNDIVTYTIRVYNEGNISGYAEEIRDDVPQGLIFMPEYETNIEYGWKLDENGQIRTSYLSKAKNSANEIEAFDRESMSTPDYRDVEVAFLVDESNLPEGRIIINTAQISKDLNEYKKTEAELNDVNPNHGDGNEDVDDEDSTPDNDILTEDDIDKEYLRVQYFDLALLKYITEVQITEDGQLRTVQTGHTGLENPEPFVKVEINKRKINTTIVKFIYTIKVTNEGEIAGYAKEIVDRIPQGLEFVEEDNPNWFYDVNGNIVTDQLADTLLNPGESATVEIVLRWINGEENLKEKVNVAEISKDYNDSNSKDIDSTPGNNIPEEDDQDDATVLLSIKTGIEKSYIGVFALGIGILGIGIAFIRKYIV